MLAPILEGLKVIHKIIQQKFLSWSVITVAHIATIKTIHRKINNSYPQNLSFSSYNTSHLYVKFEVL